MLNKSDPIHSRIMQFEIGQTYPLPGKSYLQGGQYVPVLQIEIIKLLIFGSEYQKKLKLSFEHL